MNDLRTAAQQALEALEGGADSWRLVDLAITALKAALSEHDKHRAWIEERKAQLAKDKEIVRHNAQEESERIRKAQEEGRCWACGTALAEPEHKLGCALLKIPSRDCDCGAEPVQDGPCKHCTDGCPACDIGKLQMVEIETVLTVQGEPVQEPTVSSDCADSHQPVAWMLGDEVYRVKQCRLFSKHPGEEIPGQIPLYTAPPQRKPLTDEEMRTLADKHLSCQPESYEVSGIFDLIRAIERAHGIGGQDA